MTCNGDNKECPNTPKWRHQVMWHGQLLGIYNTCDQHKHCENCEPIKKDGDVK